jgi:hypothetical protein
MMTLCHREEVLDEMFWGTMLGWGTEYFARVVVDSSKVFEWCETMEGMRMTS